MNSAEKGKDFLANIVCGIVDYPNDVKIMFEQGATTVVYRIECSKEDVGKVLGKKGRNINTIRQIFACFCSKEKIRGIIDLING